MPHLQWDRYRTKFRIPLQTCLVIYRRIISGTSSFQQNYHPCVASKSVYSHSLLFFIENRPGLSGKDLEPTLGVLILDPNLMGVGFARPMFQSNFKRKRPVPLLSSTQTSALVTAGWMCLHMSTSASPSSGSLPRVWWSEAISDQLVPFILLLTTQPYRIQSRRKTLCSELC